MSELVVEKPLEKFNEIFKTPKYRQRIAQMALSASTSLILDFEDLLIADPRLAEDLLDKPHEYFAYANSAAFEQLQIEDPEYAEKIKEIGVTVRIRGIPRVTPLRKLGSEHIGKLVMIEGIIMRATMVRPIVTTAVFRCKRCETKMEVPQSGAFLTFPYRCANPRCGKNGPFEFVQEESKFVDYQELRIQEYPEDIPPGQTPRSLDIRLVGKDIVDTARPGDRVYVVGIVGAEATSYPRAGKARTFTLYIEANFIDATSKESESLLITPEEEEQILRLAKDPFIHQKIIQSIAPSIYGYEHIKEAIMYLLFGGVPKYLPDINIRGEINILLVGDPGTAKSQILRYVQRIAPRGLYTSGRGTTAAGLTAAVLPSPGGGMTLEAGALVLADKGIACIDEIDKMRPEDRVAIHEAMEQHTISVAKGGIVATLNARTAILAAANPALGRYDPYKTVAENISLPVTILSRFDLIFVLRDVPEKDMDSKLSEHLLRLHMREAPPVEPPIPPDLLRKYIAYARNNVRPTLTPEAMERLKEFYLTMRSASEGEGSPIAITARQLEALVRIAEARARAALRNAVLAEDAEAAIAIMKKSLEEVGIDVSSKKFDIDIIMVGKPKSMQDKLRVILSAIVEMEKETGMVSRAELLEKLSSEYDIPRGEAEKLIAQMVREGTLYEPRTGYLKKT
ncbi:MAG TPA: minichromosome maintenance protein MCM [Candidatus Bathyarchaeota archaeon]|nr:minichromosome maintenance protein MCM [Candidatus Bathyarchaeota archaeon]